MREKICCSFLFFIFFLTHSSLSHSHTYFFSMDGFLEEFHLPAIDIIGGLITIIYKKMSIDIEKCCVCVCVCAKGMRKNIGEGK